MSWYVMFPHGERWPLRQSGSGGSGVDGEGVAIGTEKTEQAPRPPNISAEIRRKMGEHQVQIGHEGAWRNIGGVELAGRGMAGSCPVLDAEGGGIVR
ncbi:hypothetical protein Slin15195_G130510 [Septoria linicola]|uniref:Uncharacterized protein n=1 Tax=Septoria linicola TaxID=215465 RepID=A0A9Q9ERB3_9PEZI|nr:hypothetical protein Slin14017_G122350 [Septoria linicola]USW59732.1 hypothetical protein Slin15195_G130510 [Septoria linicola]